MRIPANVAPIPKPLIIMDTSGSMDEKDLALCRGVLQSVLKSLPCQDGVRVVTGDTQLQNCQKVFSVSSVSLVGGGGTDMGGIMHEAVEKYPEADTVIVVTDGITGWPSSPLRQKCLALLTRKSSYYPVPDWMRKVYIHPEAEE
jgi:predicted metal-dependent peptidase